jgi:hypothetical protein
VSELLLWRSTIRLALLGVVLATVVSGCGGGEDRSEPALGPTTTELGTEEFPRLQPGNRPVRFRLDTAVTPELKAFVVESLAWAHADMGDSGPLTVHVYSDEQHFLSAYTNEFAISLAVARQRLADGQTVFASPGGHVWIYLGNFEQAPTELQRFALFHEYFHTVQSWLAELRFQSVRREERSFVPRWLLEGCAEYMAARTAAARGIIDQDRTRQAVVELAKEVPDPLQTFEIAGEAAFLGGNEASYTVGFLACERLANRYGPDAVTHRFWKSLATLRDWEKAFVETMGVTPAAFYADFDAYRRTL